MTVLSASSPPASDDERCLLKNISLFVLYRRNLGQPLTPTTVGDDAATQFPLSIMAFIKLAWEALEIWNVCGWTADYPNPSFFGLFETLKHLKVT